MTYYTMSDFMTIYPTLSRRHLMTLGGRKNHGLGFGFDAERNDETRGTENLRAYMLRRWDWPGLFAAWTARPEGCTCLVCTYDTTTPKTTTTTTTKDATVPTTTTTDAATNLAAAIAAIAAQSIDPATVQAMIDKSIANLPVRERPVFVRESGERVKVDGHVRPEVTTIVENITAGVHTMLVGPAGSGKTTMMRQAAAVLGLKDVVIGCAGSEPTTFTGTWLPTGDGGRFEFHMSEFLKAVRANDTHLPCLDEWERGNPNDLLTLNDLLASGRMTCVGYGEVQRAKPWGIVAAGNTFGTGADALYDSEKMDASTLNRFDGGVLFIDYDKDLERTLADEDILTFAWTVREGIDRNNLQRIMSTRSIVAFQNLRNQHGRSLDAMQKSYFASWSRSERSKVNV